MSVGTGLARGIGLVALFAAACAAPTGGTLPPGGGGGGSEDDDALDGLESEAAPSSFDEPGDLAVASGSGTITFGMEDQSGDSNTDQEFYLVAVNTRANQVGGFDLRYISQGGAEGPPAQSECAERPALAAAAAGPAAPGVSRRAPPLPRRPKLEEDDVGRRQEAFRVRSDLQNPMAYAVKDATLWALGNHVSIWVDNDVPIEGDIDCDGSVEFESDYDTYGFDNCALEIVADIVDANIIPNVEDILGSPSDIDGDGRVDVLITPELNRLALTSASEAIQDSVVSFFAEPEVDLEPFDSTTNPGSDERETIYVLAPDPYGFYRPTGDVNFRPSPSVDTDTYVDVLLNAGIASSLATLVSYNKHVVEKGTTQEKRWLDEVMGAMAAEYCGFGAAYYASAWDYLDAPHLAPLTLPENRSTTAGDWPHYGAQYLFATWLWDWAEATGKGGADVYRAIVDADQSGKLAVEAATGQPLDGLVLGWQVALLMSGLADGDGEALLEPDGVFQPYADPYTIPDDDSFYGAKGYQRGFAPRDVNRTYIGGRSGNTSEVEDDDGNAVGRYYSRGPDANLFVPAVSLKGAVAAGHAAAVVRVTGVPYDAAALGMGITAGDFVAALVRVNDPGDTPDYKVENIYSPLDTNAVNLPRLPDDGSPVHGLGTISAPSTILTVDPEGGDDIGEQAVPDTDRWLLDLTGLRGDVDVVAWLRRMPVAAGSLEATPEDMWLAVVPPQYLPTPTPDDTNYRSTSSCSSRVFFSYPNSVLPYLYDQVVLTSTMGNPTDGFNPCGWADPDDENPPTCEFDWDDDNIADEDEPTPATFIEQIQVLQCSEEGFYYDTDPDEDFDPRDDDDPDNDGEEPEPEDNNADLYSVAPSLGASFLDADELDDDDYPLAIVELGAGGKSAIGSEDGFVAVTLEGGEQYIIVVAASSGTGDYELVVQADPR